MNVLLSPIFVMCVLLFLRDVLLMDKINASDFV
jgi:hypothetical protein